MESPSLSVELLSARGPGAHRCVHVSAQSSHLTFPTHSQRAGPDSASAAPPYLALIYDIFLQLEQKRGRRMGRDSLTGLVHVVEKTGGGRGNTDWRAEDVFLSGAS